MSDVRHWFIQKPIAHNVPLESNGAVFQEFMPTVSEHKCEWIKVYSADDIQKTIGMGWLARYSEVIGANHKLEQKIATLESEARLHDTIVTSLQRGQKALVEHLEKRIEKLREALFRFNENPGIEYGLIAYRALKEDEASK